MVASVAHSRLQTMGHSTVETKRLPSSLSDSRGHPSHGSRLQRPIKHDRRQIGRWHPYQKKSNHPQRPLFSSLPSPEISSKEVSPKLESFSGNDTTLQPRAPTAAGSTTQGQMPSPPPSDRSDTIDKTEQQVPLLSQSTARARLHKILTEPIRWVPATAETSNTEISPIVRRRVKENVTFAPILERKAVGASLPNASVRPTDRESSRAETHKSILHPEQSRKDQVIGRLVKSGRISKTWPSWANGRKPRPLHNPGNYCYRNAVMQVFLQTPAFISWLAGHQRPNDCPRKTQCIACVFLELSKKYYSSENVRRASNDFHKAFNHLWPRLRGLSSSREVHRLVGDQQDADEFVQGLLDAFCDAPSRVLPMPIDVRKSLFELTLSRTWRCSNKKCKSPDHPNVQSERALVLDISRPREHLNIGQYVAEYFKSEIVDDVTCDVCGLKGQRRRPRNLELLAGPHVLFVQLRRFERFRRRNGPPAPKIRSRVGQAPVLDLSAYQPDEYRANNKLVYELKHVVLHHGRFIESGHYTSICSGPVGRFSCDDESIRPWSKLDKIDGAEPFILVYMRKDA